MEITQGCFFTIVIQPCIGGTSQCNKARKRNGIQIANEEGKLSLFTEVIIFDAKISKESRIKLLVNKWV